MASSLASRLPMLLGCCLVGLSADGATAEDDAQVANNYYKYSNAELEAVCDRMSPTSYASGLTDGAWMAMPFAGRTYYYRSHCYLELARRTGEVAYCQRVKARSTLLGDGSAVSRASCQRMVAATQAARRVQQANADSHAAVVKGAFSMTAADLSPAPGGGWIVSVRTEGTLNGTYRFDIERLNPRKLLASQEMQLSANSQHQWQLARADVVEGAALPAIFPIAVSLYYTLPSPPAQPGRRHLTSIQNLTLSVR